jgi:activator of 2-hydroxyglutaryl-CoA dehydratase
MDFWWIVALMLINVKLHRMAMTKANQKRSAGESALPEAKKAKKKPQEPQEGLVYTGFDAGSVNAKVAVCTNGNFFNVLEPSVMYYCPQEGKFFHGYAKHGQVQINNLKMALGKTAAEAQEILGLETRSHGGEVEVCVGYAIL